MQVPFYTTVATTERRWVELVARVRGLTTSRGSMVEELEAAVEQFTGASYAVGTSSATDALTMMLRVAGVRPGDEVLVPDYTFFATASAVVHCGAVPVFVDILPGSYAMDPDKVAAAVTNKTVAMVPVHLFSQMADMSRLVDEAARYGLQVLEDSAEAIGMRMRARHAGLWGAAGVLSFFPTKTLGAFGDAGMLITNEKGLAKRARSMVAEGIFAGQMDDLQAAILLHRLEELPREIERRAVLAERYTAGLAGLAPAVVPPSVVESSANRVFYVYLIECERRDELAEYLLASGIQTEIYYPRPLSSQACFGVHNSVRHPTPVAEACSSRALALPMYPDLRNDEVDQVCELIRRFYGERG